MPVASPYHHRLASHPLRDQSLLITGGTGAFGNAFARFALDHGAKRVVIFSRGEAKQAEMQAQLTDDRLRFIIGDVCSASSILDACRGVDVVVHAAALKRVETCERNPDATIAINVLGTLNVMRACIERGVQKAVFLSTDKAASPNTLYGAAKLLAEKTWAQQNIKSAGTTTRFACTRYGNVLGSTGSVLPLWRSQHARGEKLTVTDKRCTRFFMTMDDAVHLVSLAINDMRGSEIFVPNLGSAPIVRLAKAAIDQPYALFAGICREVGLRPGEKLHELLISADESRTTYTAGTHFVIEPSERTWGDVEPLPYPLVPDGFSLASDTNRWQLSTAELRAMVAT